MFEVVSHPFAELTQGLSGLPTESNYDSHYESESSTNGWKVVIIILLLLLGVGFFIWLYCYFQKKKEEELIRKEAEKERLEEEEKARLLLGNSIQNSKIV